MTSARAALQEEETGGLMVLAPLRFDRRAARSGAPYARVRVTGLGPRRARRAAVHGRSDAGRAVAVVGLCAAIDDELETGDLVLASEVRHPGGTIELPAAGIVAGALRRAGIPIHVAPLVSHPHGVLRSERARLRASGALVADTESAWLAMAAGGRPVCVLRSVVRSGHRSLGRPLGTVAARTRASRALAEATWALDRWADAVAPRHVLLAGPRASCAGVDRAVEVVERVLEQRGAPLYVRKQIVHNAHVVRDLERRGAIFVDEIDQVPHGATLVFSAHGVSPAVRAAASARGLEVIDATCPLVAKVHAEARRFAADQHTIVLIGHEGHEEVEGTAGEAPERTLVVDSLEAVEALEVDDPERVAYLTQTTLAVDETRVLVDALSERFPRLAGPRSDDICYATQNRQDAVRGIAAECDLVLVVGSSNSSNSRRLVEVAERAGTPARLIDDEGDIDLDWIARARTVGLTAGASAPEAVVGRVLKALHGLGPVHTEERTVAREEVEFKLPPGTRR